MYRSLVEFPGALKVTPNEGYEDLSPNASSCFFVNKKLVLCRFLHCTVLAEQFKNFQKVGILVPKILKQAIPLIPAGGHHDIPLFQVTQFRIRMPICPY